MHIKPTMILLLPAVDYQPGKHSWQIFKLGSGGHLINPGLGDTRDLRIGNCLAFSMQQLIGS